MIVKQNSCQGCNYNYNNSVGNISVFWFMWKFKGEVINQAKIRRLENEAEEEKNMDLIRR